MDKKCENCKKTFCKKPSDSRKYWAVKRFCSIKCSGTTFKKGHKISEKHKNILRARSGDKSHNWKGGRYVTKVGYITIKVDRKNVLEHRHIMEQHLGRKLDRFEHVHHRNGNKADNRLENLKLMSIEEHNRMHTEERWRTGAFYAEAV